MQGISGGFLVVERIRYYHGEGGSKHAETYLRLVLTIGYCDVDNFCGSAYDPSGSYAAISCTAPVTNGNPIDSPPALADYYLRVNGSLIGDPHQPLDMAFASVGEMTPFTTFYDISIPLLDFFTTLNSWDSTGIFDFGDGTSETVPFHLEVFVNRKGSPDKSYDSVTFCVTHKYSQPGDYIVTLQFGPITNSLCDYLDRCDTRTAPAGVEFRKGIIRVTTEAILIILVKNLGGDATCADTNASPMGPGVCSGNPINNTTGNKYQTEQDYIDAGPFPLRWTRYYNSQATESDDVSANWSHSYSATIQQVSATVVHVVRADQKVLTFTLTGGVWTPDADVNARLAQLQTPQGQTTGWRYTTGEDGLETYDAAGRLLALANRTGLTQTLTYDAQGRLTAVRDPFGRTLGIAYDSSNRINRMTDPAGGLFTYTYDSQNNLVSVTYPDSTTRTYLYQNTAFPHALTGIIDENGQPFATYTYDAQGHAVSSQHAGGLRRSR